MYSLPQSYNQTSKYKRCISSNAYSPDEPVTERYILSDDYPLGKLLEKELEHEIRSAIKSLPDECRKIFISNRFQDKTYNEIAEELGISPNTVKYHIRNALAILHEQLSKYLITTILSFLTFIN